MPEAHATFHSVDGKRRVLVVEDVAINRDMLGGILGDTYDVIFANDGLEAMQRIHEHKDTLSVVLLDLIMPNMSGQEVLQQMKASPDTRDIPVIVLSADFSQEIECLNAGATDFIQKPYPDAGVIRARVRRTIELSEDRQIIQSTERDPLTGLYNREFFYSYAEQYDQYHKDAAMDAIVLDINNFSMMNERFGRAYADEVLRNVSMKVRALVHDSGGIVSRSGADVFLVYCPHRDDYKAILDNASAGLSDTQDANMRVRLRMGVYSNVDKTLDIERRFDRAKMAADTVRDSYTRSIGVYDDTLHKAELYAQQLIDDFPTALEQRQFLVYYQPKYEIQHDVPLLGSAEALVRWKHPDLGMISPGVFIPLFEENGLIQALDHYVWAEAARQIAEWKRTLGCCVPVSVNMSRVDMYDSAIVDLLPGILEEHGIEPDDLHLEVTESAYAEDSEQIIETVKRLRALGFKIEMDDFGTGYSSLNMLATLPIDALKLDMRFIRTAFAQEGRNDTHMIEVIVDIAEHLGVPVIAEGVETDEQLNALRELGCNTVQGYYFSAPVPADAFEKFLVDDASGAKRAAGTDLASDETLAQEAADQPKWWEKVPGVSLFKASVVFACAAFLAAVALFLADAMVTQSYVHLEKTSERFIGAQQAAYDLEMGSDSLTESVREFVITGDIEYLNDYFEELEVTKRRDSAVAHLEELLEGSDSAAYSHLSTALSLSNELVNYEYLAMRYTLEAGDYDEALIPAQLQAVQLSPEEQALPADEKRARAIELVFDDTYAMFKNSIKDNTRACTQELVDESDKERLEASRLMSASVVLETVLTIVLLLVVLAIVVFIGVWVRRPLARMVQLMREGKPMQPMGAAELQFVAQTYNTVLEESHRKYERLNYGSTHDSLTGLFNRKAYEAMRQDMDMSRTALLIVDVDKFKSVNDIYGHNVGDLLLKRVAEVLGYSFRSVDLLFRLGGDEFVVIMSNVDSSMRDQVKATIDQANVMLQKPTDDLPPTSLSVGVAFADRENPEGDIFKDADTALYRVKEAGRCGCGFY